MSNERFLKKIGGNKSRFYLFDFHVHSLASPDAITGKNFESLTEEEKTYAAKFNTSLASNPVEFEEDVLKKYPVEEYYNLLLKKKEEVITKQNINIGEDWAFIAITDHNVCKYATELSKYAWESEQLNTNKLVILPGIELEIVFNLPIASKEVSAHVILIFPPKTECYHIYNRIREASQGEWDFGKPIRISDLPKFIHELRHNKDFPAICIGAHVWSAKGLREETKKCLMDHLSSTIARLEAEITIEEEEKAKKELEYKLEELIEKLTDKEDIYLEILKYIGICGFDALQVRGKKDEPFYRYLHRFKQELGRAVPIICSDAHNVSDIFSSCHNDGEILVPFIKLDISNLLKEKDIFYQIRDKGLRFAETRVSNFFPGHVTSWIEGVQIIPDAPDASEFWPFEAVEEGESHKKEINISFSRNLNCLIGGRGSGKSAVIEVLSFINDINQFKQNTNKDQDWYKRARATLKGCKVKVCWKILDNNTLPKKALFVSGYFDTNDKHPDITLTNSKGENVLQSSSKIPKANVLRIHEIEKISKPENLRLLFDSICGEQINKLDDSIKEKLNALATQRKEIARIGEEINNLCNDNNPLREYMRRKEQFSKVDQDEIKNKYEKIDEITKTKADVVGIKSQWEKFKSNLNIVDRKEEAIKFFNNIRSTIYEVNKEQETIIKEHLKALEKLVADTQGESSHEIIITTNIDNLKSNVDVIEKYIIEAISEMEDLYIKETDDLGKSGLPVGSENRQVKKIALEEAEKDYDTYISLLSTLEKKLVERKTIVDNLHQDCMIRSELRCETAKNITKNLLKNLDQNILIIDADAQPNADKKGFEKWLHNVFNWNGAKFKEARINNLINEKGLNMINLKEILIKKTISNFELFEVTKNNASEGRITIDEAKQYISNNKIWEQIDPEISAEDYDKELYNELPEVVKNGLYILKYRDEKSKQLNIETALELDEIIFDDIPVIKLNDRPQETSIKREIDKLSPGQRCSAILPIVLLNGTEPIIIDQPEDNLDNRLVRQVIVNVLASIKLSRQVIMATHNPNLPVLGDAEQVIALKAVDEDKSIIQAKGTIDENEIISSITEIMEGGREAIQYRYSIYQEYWNGGAQK